MEDRVVPLESTPPEQMSDAAVISHAQRMMETRHEAEWTTLKEANSRDFQALDRAVETANRPAESREQTQLRQIAARRTNAAGSRIKAAFYAVTSAGRDKALETKITGTVEARYQQQQKARTGLLSEHAKQSDALTDRQISETSELRRGGAETARAYVRHGSLPPPQRSLQQPWREAQRSDNGPSRNRDDGTLYRMRQNDPALARYREEQRGPRLEDYRPPRHRNHAGIQAYSQDGPVDYSLWQGCQSYPSGEPSGNPYGGRPRAASVL